MKMTKSGFRPLSCNGECPETTEPGLPARKGLTSAEQSALGETIDENNVVMKAAEMSRLRFSVENELVGGPDVHSRSVLAGRILRVNRNNLSLFFRDPIRG